MYDLLLPDKQSTSIGCYVTYLYHICLRPLFSPISTPHRCPRLPLFLFLSHLHQMQMIQSKTSFVIRRYGSLPPKRVAYRHGGANHLSTQARYSFSSVSYNTFREQHIAPFFCSHTEIAIPEWETLNHASGFISCVDKGLIEGLDEKSGAHLLSPPTTFEIVPTMMGACDPSPDCVVSVYYLKFDEPLSRAKRNSLLFKLDQFRQHLQHHNEFEGMTKGWSISESSQSGDHAKFTTLMIVMGWATINDAKYLEANAKIATEVPGTEMASVYHEWFQPLLDAAHSGWTRFDISLHLLL